MKVSGPCLLVSKVFNEAHSHYGNKEFTNWDRGRRLCCDKTLKKIVSSLFLSLFWTWLSTAVAAEATKANNRGTNKTFIRTTRDPKIMYGFPTFDGEFGWQASLELFHPSLGFIGHWCGGVLIHKYWVLSSAHCMHKWVITTVYLSSRLGYLYGQSTSFLPVISSTFHFQHCGRLFWGKIIVKLRRDMSNGYR